MFIKKKKKIQRPKEQHRNQLRAVVERQSLEYLQS